MNRATRAVATSQSRAKLSLGDIFLDVRYPDRAWLKAEYIRNARGEPKVGVRWDEATEEQLDWVCWRKEELNVITFE